MYKNLNVAGLEPESSGNRPGALTTKPHVERVCSETRAWSASKRRGFESRYIQFFIRFLNKL